MPGTLSRPKLHPEAFGWITTNCAVAGSEALTPPLLGAYGWVLVTKRPETQQHPTRGAVWTTFCSSVDEVLSARRDNGGGCAPQCTCSRPYG